jgi:hypothetical protein
VQGKVTEYLDIRALRVLETDIVEINVASDIIQCHPIIAT